MRTFVLFCLLCISGIVHASEASPWGQAAIIPTEYQPQKVVYDVAVDSPAELDLILDRASGLSQVYNAHPMDASIVLVLHGAEMDFFDASKFDRYEAIMRRAQSLTVGGVIEFRMCQIAAANRGLHAHDIHGFVQMVPMGDAEIVRLQQEEAYAYMH